MIAISCEELKLSFGTEVILDGVSFSLNEGEKLGIVGVNGAGKSSLFKLITGEYVPDSGSVYLSKDKTVGILTQNVGFDGEGSVWDATVATFSSLVSMEERLDALHREMEAGSAEAASRYTDLWKQFDRAGGPQFRSRCRGILKNLGFPEEQWGEKVSSLSGGQKTRLALSCLLLRDPDILMLDEPTNHLDIDALFWLEEYLRASHKTVLVVSHDRYFLDRVADHILEIEHKKGKLYTGNYSVFAEKKRAEREIAERHYQNQQKEIARQEAYIEQQRRWNRERNIIAAESRLKLLDKMEKLDRPDALPEKIRMRFESPGESGNDVLRAIRLGKSYPGRPLFREIGFLVSKRERLFLAGPNGCGKSTLIRLLAGRDEPERGEIDYGSNVEIGYYDQENQQLDEKNTVLDEVWDKYGRMTETEVRSALALFQFRGDDVFKRVSVLSGGEKARLTLTKLILGRMNLLILDEPTNHLDINSREVLEEALEAFDGTLIAVSHDRYFIKKLATRILAFPKEGGEAVGVTATGEGSLLDYRGTYEDFLRFREEHAASNEVEKNSDEPISENKAKYLDRKKANAEERKAERRLKNAKERITAVEARITAIDGEMNASDGTDYVALAALETEKNALEEELLGLYETVEEMEGL